MPLATTRAGLPVPEIGRKLGAMWHELSEKQRQAWKAKADKAKAEEGGAPTKKQVDRPGLFAVCSLNACASFVFGQRTSKKSDKSEKKGTKKDTKKDTKKSMTLLPCNVV